MISRREARKSEEAAVTDRGWLRLGAALVVVGEIAYIVAGSLHPGHEDPNNHPAVFAEYAASATWTMVHLGQFMAFALILAGLLAVFVALDRDEARSTGVARSFGIAAVVAALALSAVLQGVDGVTLKQAVDRWAAADGADKTAAFAAAEAVRWLEWGIRSYQRMVFGVVYALVAVALVAAGGLFRVLGAIAAIVAVAYVAEGVVVGNEGFSTTNAIPSLIQLVARVAFAVGLAIAAWRGGRIGNVGNLRQA
jgi:hypothetical protein